MSGVYNNFRDFYPFYLSEHSNRINRRLHFFGTFCSLLVFVFVILTGNWAWVGLALVIGYGFAWAGHFFFEQNRPATFRYPFYSLAGDLVMFRDMLTGRIRF